MRLLLYFTADQTVQYNLNRILLFRGSSLTLHETPNVNGRSLLGAMSLNVDTQFNRYGAVTVLVALSVQLS